MSGGDTLAVRLPNWLGDAVLALRAVDALAAQAGPSRLALFARSWAEPLFGARWPGARWSSAPSAGGGWPSAVPALASLHAASIVVFPPSPSARLHAFFAGVPHRIGLGGEPLDFLLTHRAPRAARGERHLEDEYLDLARLEGAAPVPRMLLACDEAARARVRAQLGDATNLLLIAPGARYGPAKRWPPERFAEVATAWPGTVVLVGGGEDAGETAAVRAACAPGARVLDWAGRTSLPELLAPAHEARATVSNDSGVAHLAAAAGRPTIAVFGSTDPRWTAPRGPAVRVVTNPPPCSPCFLRTCRIPERYLCLRRVAPRDVIAALGEVAA